MKVFLFEKPHDGSLKSQSGIEIQVLSKQGLLFCYISFLFFFVYCGGHKEITIVKMVNMIKMSTTKIEVQMQCHQDH